MNTSHPTALDFSLTERIFRYTGSGAFPLSIGSAARCGAARTDLHASKRVFRIRARMSARSRSRARMPPGCACAQSIRNTAIIP